MANEIKSLKRIIDRYKYLNERKIGFPHIGNRKDGNSFSTEVNKVASGFELYDNLISSLNNDYTKEINLTSGNPMNHLPFKPAIKQIEKILKGTELNKYPYSEGDDRVRIELLKYIEQEGFINNNPYNYNDIDDKGLSIHNITFTVSTSHAFGLILDIIARPYDIVLMTGPNYGLFSFKPERINAKVEIIALEEEDNYLINPDKLSKKIKELNKDLENKYRDKLDYIPKVVAFVNGNPCNPTGKVMGENEINILEGIGSVCKELGVFIIDDLVYRDLTYDKNNIAKPIGTIPGMFKNTISLFGLSKAYGLAGLRAGFVVADEIIIRELINRIFQELDAVPSIIGEALKGAYNTSMYRNKKYKKYFNELNDEYIFRYNILKAFVNGIDSINNRKLKNKVYKYIKNNIKDKSNLNILKNGITDVKIKNTLEPQSGFFVILDFTSIKGRKYKGNSILTEEDLLNFFYREIKLRFIIGKSMLWPNEAELIGRVTFAKERIDIINYCVAINNALNKLD